MTTNNWELHIPDHSQILPPTSRPLIRPPTNCSAAEGFTVLDRARELLTPHPKSRFCLRNAERFASTTPLRSRFTEDVLRAAIYTADRSYSGSPLLGRRLSADRIQRLVLGIAELLQAELIADPGCDFDQLEEELLAASRCVRAGFKAESDDELPPDDDCGDDEEENSGDE